MSTTMEKPWQRQCSVEAHRCNEVIKAKETVITKDQVYKNVYLDYFHKWKKYYNQIVQTD